MTTYTTRRKFLAAGAAAGGALVGLAAKADDHPKKAHHPQKVDDEVFKGVFVAPSVTSNLNQRMNIAFLPDNELDQLREAFRVLRANNDAIYNSWVNIHVSNCQHNNNLIWPWHRAYLYYFERRLQQAVPGANPPVTLPFWSYDRIGDGTGTDTREFRRLPEQYRPRTLVGGQQNSLWVSRREDVNGGTYVLPFGSVRTDRIVAGNPRFASFTANIENQPHNNVHNLLGLPMRDPLYSPRDPVFWLHHTNLDRAWESWRAVPGHEDLLGPSLARWRRTPLPGFTGMQFPRRLVEDFLSIDALGYTYVDQVIEVALRPGEEAQTLTGAEVDFATAVLRPPAPVAVVRPVRIRFDQVRRPVGGLQLQVRVFLGVPDANTDTPLDHPGFAGMFTLFPTHIDHGSADPAVTLDLDVTDAVRTQTAGGKTTKLQVTLVTVPVADDDKPVVAAVQLKYKGVSVVIGD